MITPSSTHPSSPWHWLVLGAPSPGPALPLGPHLPTPPTPPAHSRSGLSTGQLSSAPAGQQVLSRSGPLWCSRCTPSPDPGICLKAPLHLCSTFALFSSGVLERGSPRISPQDENPWRASPASIWCRGPRWLTRPGWHLCCVEGQGVLRARGCGGWTALLPGPSPGGPTHWALEPHLWEGAVLVPVAGCPGGRVGGG